MMDWTQSCTGRQARESLTEEATSNLRPKEETASAKHCEEKEPYVQAEEAVLLVLLEARDRVPQ